VGGFADGVSGDARVVTFFGAIGAAGDFQNNDFSVIDLFDGFRCLQLFVVSKFQVWIIIPVTKCVQKINFLPEPCYFWLWVASNLGC
jgi:hypothetical protein